MGSSKSQTITLAVAIASLTSNTLSSLLFHQLPDDPYHLASNYGWYLHFASLISICGFVGALRKHAPSIAIFSNYLLLDTLLSSIPRFLLLGFLQPFSTTLCAPSSLSNNNNNNNNPSLISQSTPPNSLSLLPESSYTYITTTDPTTSSFESQIGQFTEGWTPEGCERILWLAQLTLAAGLVAATLLQLVGALCVREYARWTWERECRREDGEGKEDEVESERRRGIREKQRFGLGVGERENMKEEVVGYRLDEKV